jgi:succinate dehydrogenase / fumarate reductase cytochrome b subunit
MEATTTEAGEGRSLSYVRSKLASLLAFAPLGIWTVIHVWNNLASLRGEAEWQASVTHYGHPISLLITSIVVLLPLVLHTVWGILRLRTSRPNNTRYGYFENLKYLLQRLSAVGVLAFLGAHLWLAFLHPRIVEKHPEKFADIAAEMHHNPPTLIVYLLGTLGVAYHLGNGLSGFAWNWGITSSRKAVIRMEKVGIVLFVILLVMSWAAIYGLWRAGAAFPAPVD